MIVTRTARQTSPPVYFVGRTATVARVFLQWIVLWPVIKWFCHPLIVRNRPRKLEGPVVFVANHASHADTAVILRSLPLRVRARTMPAAAEDHFWRSQIKGACVSLLTGAFPFPRRGDEGLKRSEQLLARGRSILLFPEGTRAKDGCLAEFQKGIGLLADQGATIVPIGVAGTQDVLPKGSSRPRSAPVSVTFGEPQRFSGEPQWIAAAIRAEVAALLACEEERNEERSPIFFERLTHFAQSRAALIAVMLWAFVEALAWPVVPDFFILPLALLAPRRCLLFVAAAIAGSVSGGCVAHSIGSTSLGAQTLDLVPLVTDGMVETARDAVRVDGPRALLEQPLSGIPYKVFAYEAGAAQVNLWGFIVATAIGRGARFAGVAIVGAFSGRVLRPVWERFLALFLLLYSAAFAIGLARVVAAWR